MENKVKLFVPVFFSPEYFAENYPRIHNILRFFCRANKDKNAIEVIAWDGNVCSLPKNEPSLVMFSDSFKIFENIKKLRNKNKKSLEIVESCLQMGHFLFWNDRQLMLPINVFDEFGLKPFYLKPPRNQPVLRFQKFNRKMVERWSISWSLELEGVAMERNLYGFLGFESIEIQDSKNRC